jgi:hypothetical protein
MPCLSGASEEFFGRMQARRCLVPWEPWAHAQALIPVLYRDAGSFPTTMSE